MMMLVMQQSNEIYTYIYEELQISNGVQLTTTVHPLPMQKVEGTSSNGKLTPTNVTTAASTASSTARKTTTILGQIYVFIIYSIFVSVCYSTVRLSNSLCPQNVSFIYVYVVHRSTFKRATSIQAQLLLFSFVLNKSKLFSAYIHVNALYIKKIQTIYRLILFLFC